MKFDGILLCSDFDRTFTDHTKNYAEGENVLAHVPEKNLAAVKRFVTGGGVFAIVSGRNPDEISLLADYAPIADLCVASNGTAVYSISEKRAVVSYTMDEDFLRTLRYLVSDGGMTFFRITDNDFRFAYWREGDDFDKAVSVAKFPVYKAIVENESEERIEKWRRELIGKFAGEYSIELSGSRTLEICPKGSGKAQALVKMRELLESRRGKKFDKLVCVGDNQNDVGMIALADIGFAVGNAIPAAKLAATEITVPASDGAIEAVVNRLYEMADEIKNNGGRI